MRAGMFLFKVATPLDHKYFVCYSKAKVYRQSIEGNVSFYGFHITRGWIGLFHRIINPIMIDIRL